MGCIYSWALFHGPWVGIINGLSFASHGRSQRFYCPIGWLGLQAPRVLRGEMNIKKFLLQTVKEDDDVMMIFIQHGQIL